MRRDIGLAGDVSADRYRLTGEPRNHRLGAALVEVGDHHPMPV